MEALKFGYIHKGNVQFLPGFNFHPIDEDVITHYLMRKALDSSFIERVNTEVDLNKCEPWNFLGMFNSPLLYFPVYIPTHPFDLDWWYVHTECPVQIKYIGHFNFINPNILCNTKLSTQSLKIRMLWINKSSCLRLESWNSDNASWVKSDPI